MLLIIYLDYEETSIGRKQVKQIVETIEKK